MSTALPIAPRFVPALDPGFVPASLWNGAYRARVAEPGGRPLAVALERSDGSVSVFHSAILPHAGGAIALDHLYLNQRYVERLLKFLLWQKGGWCVTIAPESLTAWSRLPCGSCCRDRWEARGARRPRKKTCDPRAKPCGHS